MNKLFRVSNFCFLIRTSTEKLKTISAEQQVDQSAAAVKSVLTPPTASNISAYNNQQVDAGTLLFTQQLFCFSPIPRLTSSTLFIHISA